MPFIIGFCAFPLLSVAVHNGSGFVFSETRKLSLPAEVALPPVTQNLTGAFPKINTIATFDTHGPFAAIRSQVAFAKGLAFCERRLFTCTIFDVTPADTEVVIKNSPSNMVWRGKGSADICVITNSPEESYIVGKNEWPFAASPAELLIQKVIASHEK